MSKRDFIVFDGNRKRTSPSSVGVKPVENRHDIRQVLGSFYGGLPLPKVMKNAKLTVSQVGRIIFQNSRPIDVEPLAIDRKLRRAA